MEKKAKYHLVVGKNKTGKTKYLNEIEKKIDIFQYHLLEFDSVKCSMYNDLMKKNNIEVVPTNNLKEIKNKISNIEKTTEEIKNKLISLRKSDFYVDKDLKLYENIFSCRHHSLENKNCLVCNNDFNSDILIAHQRELGLYIEQQHTNFKNKADYNNLKLQYQYLEKKYSEYNNLLQKIDIDTDKHKSIYDNFISHIEKEMKDELKINDPQVKIENNSITITPVLSRTNRVYLSFIIANYFYEDETIVFDDIGLDTDNLKNLIKFIHEKKYNNDIYISSLIKPKGRTLQSWTIIEL